MNSDLLGTLGLYWGEVVRRRRRALAMAWLVLLITVPLTYIIPDRYRSNAIISIDTDALMAQMMNNATILSEATNQAENVRLLMFSQNNLEKAVMNADLDLALSDPYERNKFINTMLQNLKIQLIGRDTYGVSYVNQDPKVAQKIVEQIINIFIDINLKKLNTDADHNVHLTMQRVAELEAKFNEAQKELINFREKNNLKFQNESGLSADLRTLDINEERFPLDLRNIDARMRQLSLTLQATPRTLSGIAGSDPCHTATLKSQLLEMTSRGLTDSHPDIVNAKNLLASLEQACKKTPTITNSNNANPAYTQINDQLASLKLERDTLVHNMDTIKAQRSKINAQLLQQPALVEALRNIEVRVSTINGQLQLARETATHMQQTLDSNKKITLVKYQIAQPATYPLIPEFPNRPILLFVAAFASLLAGMVGVIVEIQLTGRMPTMTALRSAFDIPILGGISNHSRARALWSDVIFWIGLGLFVATPVFLVGLLSLV